MAGLACIAPLVTTHGAMLVSTTIKFMQKHHVRIME
jgi:hypothetical protein